MKGPVHLKRVTLETTIVCTRAKPWKRGVGVGKPGTLILHPDATETKRPATGWAGGEVIERQCPNCGYSWPTEHRSITA